MDEIKTVVENRDENNIFKVCEELLIEVEA